MENRPGEQNLLIYHTDDGRAAVSLYARDGNVWMNQNQLAELFATSVPNISTHLSNILKEKELAGDSVVKDYQKMALRFKLEFAPRFRSGFSQICVRYLRCPPGRAGVAFYQRE